MRVTRGIRLVPPYDATSTDAIWTSSVTDEEVGALAEEIGIYGELFYPSDRGIDEAWQMFDVLVGAKEALDAGAYAFVNSHQHADLRALVEDYLDRCRYDARYPIEIY